MSMDRTRADSIIITIGVLAAAAAVVRDLHFHADRRPAIESAAGALVVTFLGLVVAEIDPMSGIAIVAVLGVGIGKSLFDAPSSSANTENVASVIARGLFSDPPNPHTGSPQHPAVS